MTLVIGDVSAPPLRVAVALGRSAGGTLRWANLPAVVLPPSWLVPPDETEFRGWDVEGWAVYLWLDSSPLPVLLDVRDRLGHPSKLPFSEVWDVTFRDPVESVGRAVAAWRDHHAPGEMGAGSQHGSIADV